MKSIKCVGVLAGMAAMVMSVGASAAFAASEFQTNEGALEGTTITGTGGTATFETEKGATVTCEHSSSTGEINGPFEGHVTVTYSGKCTLAKAIAGNGACTEPIKTEQLTVQPGTIAAGAGVVEPTERGLDFSASGPLAKFECGSGLTKASITVTGSLICESRGKNVGPTSEFLKTGEVVCESGPNHGEQLYTSINVDGTNITEDFLTADGEVFGIKTTEKDQQETVEHLTFGKAGRQT